MQDIKAVYFVGAGGIGMSAIARYFINRGLVVAGYDKTPSALTLQLEKEGMLIHYEEDVNQIPQACRDKEHCLVIYTPAIPSEHAELQFFRNGGFDIQKRAQVLGTLTKSLKGLCFAGTHGKTTTSTMCAHIMHQSSADCNAFLGGISKNYGTNYILSNESPYVVIEADEFDRSFHWLSPWMSVITATDPDHLDIYGTKEAYLESFRHYTTLIQPGGALIIHTGLEVQPEVQEGVRVYTYSKTEGDFHAENIKIENGNITFDFISPVENVRGIELGQPIPINIVNGIAAMAIKAVLPLSTPVFKALCLLPDELTDKLPHFVHTKELRYALGMNMSLAKYVEAGKRGIATEKELSEKLGGKAKKAFVNASLAESYKKAKKSPIEIIKANFEKQSADEDGEEAPAKKAPVFKRLLKKA